MSKRNDLEKRGIKPNAYYWIDEDAHTAHEIPENVVVTPDGKTYKIDPVSGNAIVPESEAFLYAQTVPHAAEDTGDFKLSVERRDGILAVSGVGEEHLLMSRLGIPTHQPARTFHDPAYPLGYAETPTVLSHSEEYVASATPKNRKKAPKSKPELSLSPISKNVLTGLAKFSVPVVVLCTVAAQSSLVGGDDRSIAGMSQNILKATEFVTGLGD